MVVGICTVDLLVPESRSLKDKRQVIRSLIDNLQNRFKVSAAEVDRLDSWQHATIGFVFVSNDSRFTVQVLNKAMDMIRSNPRISVEHYSIETL